MPFGSYGMPGDYCGGLQAAIVLSMTEPTSHTFISQGLTLHYLDWGNEGAPLLILIHGTSDHARSWDWTARALKGRFHVIALDLRGHGDSQWSPDGAYLLAYHVADLADLIEFLGETRVTIVGHSFGGSVASRYAALYPDRIHKLALVDGFGPAEESYAKWAEFGAVPRAREWIEKRRDVKRKTTRRLATIEDAAARMSASNPRISPTQVRHLAEHGVRLHPDGYAWKFDPRVNQFTSEDFAVKITTFWREITAPTLLIRGAESWTHDPDATGQAAHLRDHRSVAIPKAGHWPHHDQFESFLGILQDYLN
jgi:pimeloyl-ACP methyl ester carboxylesterase